MTPLRLIALGLLIAAAPAAARDSDYAGADAGYLVYSVGTVRIGMAFTFSYRPVVDGDALPAGDWSGKIAPQLGGAFTLKIKNPDFSGTETGHVRVRRLPPGRYEVNDFSFGGTNLAGTSYRWSPGKTFSLPFEISSGKATYIGSFMRSPSLGTPLQATLGAAGYFIVADRSGRDLPIVSGRLPAGTAVIPQVTDVAPLGGAALQTEVR